jgi:pimeloyl-ACP methyl ester carboxylesterase
MPTFAAFDGTQLSYDVIGSGRPLICLPGGPARASVYLGDLGGLGARRRLIRLDLRGSGGSAAPADPATYRYDRQVGDVEALREHLGVEQIDVLAHSAGGDLAVLYAARYPERVARLALITPSAQALGIEFTERDRREAAGLRMGEPWFTEAYGALGRIWTGRGTDADWEGVRPFTYGRWDAAARAHAASGAAQRNADAAARYAAEGAFDPQATRAALAGFGAPVLVLAGELDGGPRPRVAGEVARVFPKGECVVQRDGGHFPWLDDAGWFVGAVAGFLG